MAKSRPERLAIGGNVTVMASPKISGLEVRSVQVDPAMRIFEYLSKAASSGVSLVRANLDGHHSRRINRSSAKLYFVLKGLLKVRLDGTEYSARELDCVVVQPGKWVEMDGYGAEMLIVCSPAFDPSDEALAEA